MKKLIFALTISLFAMLPRASAVTVLPDPGETFDGLPVAQLYHDFVSYSAQLLTQFQYAGFNGAAGVGKQDIVVLAHASGQKNDKLDGGFVFESPALSASGNSETSFTGTWGAGARDNGPVHVDDLLAYLHNQFDSQANTPVFTFDLAQDQNQDLNLVAKFSVWDPVSGTEKASWALDANTSGYFDPDAFVPIQGHLSIPGDGLPTTLYTVDNTGSGKYDYLFYAPTMDLSAFSGLGYEFHILSSMNSLNGSGEEAFISGAFRTPTTPVHTPEPGTILLVGSSLLGLAFRRLKRAGSLNK